MGRATGVVRVVSSRAIDHEVSETMWALEIPRDQGRGGYRGGNNGSKGTADAFLVENRWGGDRCR